MRQSRKLKKLERVMDKSTSYEEWREAAIQHDELSGQQRWREVDQSRQYDYSQIRLRRDRLRSLQFRARRDPHCGSGRAEHDPVRAWRDLRSLPVVDGARLG